MKIYQKLLDKGWEKEEIHRAVSILKFGKSNQTNFHHITTRSIIWIGLLVLILINMISSIILVPILVLIKHHIALLFVMVIGLGFGYVFSFLLKDIEFEDPRHHIITGIFMPTIAIINIYVAVTLTNEFLKVVQLATDYNPAITSFIYVVSFMLPYLYQIVPGFTEFIIRKTYKTH